MCWGELFQLLNLLTGIWIKLLPQIFCRHVPRCSWYILLGLFESMYFFALVYSSVPIEIKHFIVDHRLEKWECQTPGNSYDQPLLKPTTFNLLLLCEHDLIGGNFQPSERNENFINCLNKIFARCEEETVLIVSCRLVAAGWDWILNIIALLLLFVSIVVLCPLLRGAPQFHCRSNIRDCSGEHVQRWQMLLIIIQPSPTSLNTEF